MTVEKRKKKGTVMAVVAAKVVRKGHGLACHLRWEGPPYRYSESLR